jgi:membrane protein implicated in regulation of membrane protease activity
MSGWILWLLLACAFGVGELLTTGFFLGPFAIGAAGAAVVDVAGGGDLIGLGVFVVASFVTLMTLRPLLQSRLMANTPTLRTGSARLIGHRGIVLERIANHEGVGSVRLEGEVWSARSLDDDHEIVPGTTVEVVDIRGATALVME